MMAHATPPQFTLRWLARSSVSALAVLLALLAPRAVRAEGITYYVRVDTGVDTNNGLSSDNAVRTIGKGARLAHHGDRVVVGPGVYEEGDLPSGSPGVQLTDFYRVSFIADTSGTQVGTAPGPVVIKAAGHASGFELSNNLAVTIDGFVIYGAGNGIYVKSGSHQSQIVNNIVTGNSDNGIYVQDSTRVVVFNNLVYANERVGILITGDTIGSRGAAVINNTVYGNGDRGIFFSGTSVGSPGGLVLNNAVEANGGQAGIQVNPVSLIDYVGAGNVAVDRFESGTPVDASDIHASTLYAIDTDGGADGIFGGAGFADDDFHFNQTASGQSTDSPILDAGVVTASALGFTTASTRSDGQPDEGIADAGYHYGNAGTTAVPALADLRYIPVYVDGATGQDFNTGATPEQALRTLGGAMSLGRAGNRIILTAGTYREGDFTPMVKGPGGRDLSIVGSDGTIIDTTLRERGGFLVEKGGWISLTDLTITGARIAAVQVRNTSRADLTRVSLVANSGLAVWAQTQSVVSVTDSQLDQNRSGVRNDDSEVTVNDCTICASCQEGARTKGGTLRVFDSTVELGSDDGISVFEADELTLANTTVGGHQKTGVQVNLTGTVSVTDSVIFDNRGPGVRLLDVPGPVVFNNLIYKNGSSGAVISGDTNGSPNAQVLNNTFYQNANRGLLLGGSDQEPPSPTATVLRNIFAGNGVAGLQVNRLSLPGYIGDYTLSADAYGPGTPLGDHDIVALPMFMDPDGPDDVLAGTGVADDDFHLQQLSAGQSMQSPAVDAGGIDAIAAGVEHRSTRSDNVIDAAVADLGFHYPLTAIRHCDAALAVRTCTPVILGDCDGDGQLTINELVLGVNIALGAAPMAECTRLDEDGNGSVSVAELVDAVKLILKTS